MRIQFLKSRFNLIFLGIALGWIARMVLGAPAEETGPARTIDRPMQQHAEEVIDLPILKANSDSEGPGIESGMVPPIQIPQFLMDEPLGNGRVREVSFDEFFPADYSHGLAAKFEAHGEQLCASGCAASRHPTARLTNAKFTRLIQEYSTGPIDETNRALEELVFFGPQTRRMFTAVTTDALDSQRAQFLWDQLRFTHAKVSIRVKDDEGTVRTWIDPTRVPFDRRHEFEMQTKDVQPLVTSGTVKRVGLNHIWVRL